MSAADLISALEAVEGCEPCPIEVLGQKGMTLYYRSASGELIGLSASHHTTRNIEKLFGGKLEWLQRAYPSKSEKKGALPYDLTSLCCDLFAKAQKMGFFDPNRNMRGLGAWRARDGDVIYHAGDSLWIDGLWRPAGERLGRHFYPATLPIEPPADRLATREDGLELLRFLENWNWLSPPAAGHPDAGRMAPRLLLGWLAASVVCGALYWRPHVMLTGGRQTGKSTLADLIEAFHGDALLKYSEPTAAGVRQALEGAARPVAIDEIESDPENNRAKQVVELARLASTEGQGAVPRGSPEGKVTTWFIRASFLFSAILPPILDPQDAGRVTELALGALPAPETGDQARIRAGIRETALRGPALRARILHNFPRLGANLEIYRAALAENKADSRQCDQFGTLLAAADVMTLDHTTEFEVALEVAKCLLPSEFVPEPSEDGPALCVAHLLSTPIELFSSAGNRCRSTLGELVQRALMNGLASDRKLLRSYGLALRGLNDEDYLCIANHHRSLDQIFGGTRWEKRTWRRELQRVRLAVTNLPPVSFAGVTARATWLPIEALNLPQNEE